MQKLLFIFAILFCLSSCEDEQPPCEPKILGEYTIEKEVTKVNPYSGNEALIFETNSGETVTFYGKGRERSYTKYQICKDCCNDYYSVECCDQTLFKASMHKAELKVNIAHGVDLATNVSSNGIVFDLTAYDKNNLPNYTSFNGLLIDSLGTIAKQDSFYAESYTLRNQTYMDVYYLRGTSPTNSTFSADSLFYTKTNGVIGIKFRNGELWLKKL